MSATGWQPVRRYAPGIDRSRAACALGGIGLLVCLLTARWFGAVGPTQGLERTGHQLSFGAGSSLPVERWLLLALCAGGLCVGVLGPRHEPIRRVVLALGVVVTLPLAYRILIALPQPQRIVDVKLGGYVGLLCAVAVSVGAADGWRRSGAPLADDANPIAT